MLITVIIRGKNLEVWHSKSLGGGAIRIDEFDAGDDSEVYTENNFEEIKRVEKQLEMKLISREEYDAKMRELSR